MMIAAEGCTTVSLPWFKFKYGQVDSYVIPSPHLQLSANALAVTMTRTFLATRTHQNEIVTIQSCTNKPVCLPLTLHLHWHLSDYVYRSRDDNRASRRASEVGRRGDSTGEDEDQPTSLDKFQTLSDLTSKSGRYHPLL